MEDPTKEYEEGARVRDTDAEKAMGDRFTELTREPIDTSDWEEQTAEDFAEEDRRYEASNARQQALGAAVQLALAGASPASTSPDNILASARKFEAFLLGEDETEGEDDE